MIINSYCLYWTDINEFRVLCYIIFKETFLDLGVSLWDPKDQSRVGSKCKVEEYISTKIFSWFYANDNLQNC